MTDPFKKQRYSPSNILRSSSSSQIHNLLAPIQETTYTRYTPDIYSSSDLPQVDINKYERDSSNKENDIYSEEKQKDTTYDQKIFIEAHIDSNKDLIGQLKSNIELLFKATKIIGQLSLFPLKVLRWQCQIHSESSKYHLTPFTLMPVFYNLNYQHGSLSLWKGCFSMAAYNGIKMISESVIGEVVCCEKDFNDVNSSQKLYGHAALKFIVCALATPIFSAVIYESVQSGISNESIGLLDLMKETRNRLTGYKYNYRTRLIPFWSLILPTSCYFMGVHFLSIGLEKIANGVMSGFKHLFNEKRRMYGIDEVEQEIVEQPYLNAITQLSSQIGALVIMYPVETVLNRLIVQGTRTIIDNTDNGLGVVPINTRYVGFFDCVHSIKETEGIFGFYKGIGSLVTETVIFYVFLKFAKVVASRIYDSEWTSRADTNKIQNLMTAGNTGTTGCTTPSSISPTSQRQTFQQQRDNDSSNIKNKFN